MNFIQTLLQLKTNHFFNLGYAIEAESGTEITTAVQFNSSGNSPDHEIQFPIDTVSSPLTFSFWFKPLIESWNTGLYTGSVEGGTNCNQNGYSENYIGINRDLYYENSQIFQIGTEITFGDYVYYIDAITVPPTWDCNAGVALVYIVTDESLADGNIGTFDQDMLWPFIIVGTEWSLDTEPDINHTTLLAPTDDETPNFWQIILDDSDAFPRLGWKSEGIHGLSFSPVHSTEWYHAAFVHDPVDNDLNLYLNGGLEGSFPTSYDIFTDSGIGINLSGSGNFRGSLTQFSVWADTLSPIQIFSIFQKGISNDLLDSTLDLPLDQIIGYWKMDENQGETAMDYSGNDYHASLSNAEWIVDLISSDTEWLSLSMEMLQNIGANQTDIVGLGINSHNLNAGVYYGFITLTPSYGSGNYDETITTVVLNVMEPLHSDPDVVPKEFVLHQNFPNPFNPVTEIKYEIPKVADVSITIFNILGKEVYRESFKDLNQGYHSLRWDARNINGKLVSAGVYFYTLEAKNAFTKTKKMILLK